MHKIGYTGNQYGGARKSMGNVVTLRLAMAGSPYWAEGTHGRGGD